MATYLHLDNQNISEIDVANVTSGNPGIGGTEYISFLLAELMFEDNLTLVLAKVQNNTKITKCRTLIIEKLETFLTRLNSSDVIIVNNNQLSKLMNLNKEILAKVIVWSHLWLSYDETNFISKSKFIYRNIFVSKQMYDYYIDNAIMLKSNFIFHSTPMNLTSEITDYNFEERENIVTYVGSIVPEKNLHVLTSQWFNVLQKVPDAKLYIIGSGTLYDRKINLGRYNIAKSDYEKLVVEPILDSKGLLHGSVNFLGTLGHEKESILTLTKVGIVNPLGHSETFCLSALDFLQYAVPVVTINKFSFPDLIDDGFNGLLYKNKNKLSKYIVRLLLSKDYNEFAMNAYESSKKFCSNNFQKSWIKILIEVENNESVVPLAISYPYSFKKTLKYLYSFIQRATDYRLKPLQRKK